MNKAIGIALLVAGVVLLILGASSVNSFGSDVSRFFTGAPTEKSIWLLISGIVSGIAGLVLTLKPARY